MGADFNRTKVDRSGSEIARDKLLSTRVGIGFSELKVDASGARLAFNEASCLLSLQSTSVWEGVEGTVREDRGKERNACDGGGVGVDTDARSADTGIPNFDKSRVWFSSLFWPLRGGLSGE